MFFRGAYLPDAVRGIHVFAHFPFHHSYLPRYVAVSY